MNAISGANSQQMHNQMNSIIGQFDIGDKVDMEELSADDSSKLKRVSNILKQIQGLMMGGIQPGEISILIQLLRELGRIMPDFTNDIENLVAKLEDLKIQFELEGFRDEAANADLEKLQLNMVELLTGIVQNMMQTMFGI